MKAFITLLLQDVFARAKASVALEDAQLFKFAQAKISLPNR